MINPMLNVVAGYSPIIKFGLSIADLAMGATKENISSNKNLDVLELEAKKQELNIALAEAQARVAQELAIARRIEVAEQVEIEEFYDLNGDANFGAQTKGKTVSLGLNASGQKVSKRIYKFTGVSSALSNITSEQDFNLLTKE